MLAFSSLPITIQQLLTYIWHYHVLTKSLFQLLKDFRMRLENSSPTVLGSKFFCKCDGPEHSFRPVTSPYPLDSDLAPYSPQLAQTKRAHDPSQGTYDYVMRQLMLAKFSANNHAQFLLVIVPCMSNSTLPRSHTPHFVKQIPAPSGKLRGTKPLHSHYERSI